MNHDEQQTAGRMAEPLMAENQHKRAADLEGPENSASIHGEQHPIALYLVVWALLFVLSACSYLVDYLNFHGYPRWGLIILFMLLKAGLIVAVFMHMAWERLALASAILIPPLAVLVFVGTMAFEGDYTNLTRMTFFASG